MKPEPLKDKIKYLGTGKAEDDARFKKQDIKSAVEWLKEQINIRDSGDFSYSGGFNYELINKLIDEAFEDVKCQKKK